MMVCLMCLPLIHVAPVGEGSRHPAGQDRHRVSGGGPTEGSGRGEGRDLARIEKHLVLDG